MCGICFGVSSRASTSQLHPPSVNNTDGQASTAPGSSAPPMKGTTPDTRGNSSLLVNGDAGRQLDPQSTWETIVNAVRPRGPDSSTSLVRHVNIGGTLDVEMRFHASILHMRGDSVTPQPFTADNGDVFLFNGEVFDGLEVGLDENDGQKLFEQIQREGPSNFLAAIRNIEGPYAFVYYQASADRVYFSRDPLGRRSLLIHKPTPESPFLYLASNGPSVDFDLNEWEDVSCDALHCYNLKDVSGVDPEEDAVRGMSSYPRYSKSYAPIPDSLARPVPIYCHRHSSFSSQIYPFDRINTSIPSSSDLPPISSPGLPPLTPELQIAMQSLLAALVSSIRKRVLSVPLFPPPPNARIGVLFSGGIDCTTLALLADRVLPEGESIDLINVAFENPRSVSASKNRVEVKPRWKGAGKRASKGKSKGQAKAVVEGTAAVMEEVTLEDAPVVEPPAPVAVEEEDPLSIYEVPDRLTGRASLAELRTLRPDRKWNFVEVNVTYEEMLREKGKVIELMRPNRTVMSIAIAFYFAARGVGIASSSLSLPPQPYTSHARVLLSGLGADELLAGYARHRRAFYSTRGVEGWETLIAELQMDLDRLWIRNLGRDDRIVSSLGKEVRYPFLDAEVVDLCCRTPIWLKTDPRLAEGTGDKLLLRQLAKELGLSEAAGLKKRAIHFGAKTAKMEMGSGKVKGQFDLD